MSNFEHEYLKLNQEQRQAVDLIDGPLLVLAGPGTGKTQLLSARVANILLKTDVDASSILCLTFTNKAVVNMKERIISIAGGGGGTKLDLRKAPPSPGLIISAASSFSSSDVSADTTPSEKQFSLRADSPWEQGILRNSSRTIVKTFHSLSAEIMNTYPDKFWNAAKLSTIPQSVQVEVIQDVLDDLDQDHPLALKFAGQYTLVNDVQKSISLCKEAGLTPEKLRAIILANLAYIDKVEPILIEIFSGSLSIKKLSELELQINALPDQPIDEYIKPLLSLSTVIKTEFTVALKKDLKLGKTTNLGKLKSSLIQTIDGVKSMSKQRERNEWWLKLADVYESYRGSIHARGYYDYADMLVEVLGVIEQNPDIRADLQERFEYVLIDEFQDTNPAQLRLAHLIADHFSANGKPNIMVVGDDDQSIYKFNGALVSNMADFKRSYKDLKTVILTRNYRSDQKIIDSSEKIISQSSYRLTDIDQTLDKNLIAQNQFKNSSVRATMYETSEAQYSILAHEIKQAYSSDKTIAILARSHDSLIKMSSMLNQLKVPIKYEKQSNVLENEIIINIYQIFKLVQAINGGDSVLANSLMHKILRRPMWQVQPELLWQLAIDNNREPDWLKSIQRSSDKSIKYFYSWLKAMTVITPDQPLALSLEYALGLRELKNAKSPLKDFYLKDSTSAHEYLSSLSAIQLIRSLVHEYSADDQPRANDFCKLIEINNQNNKVIADESPYISGNNPVNLLTVHKAKGLEFDYVYIIDAIESIWSPSYAGRKPPMNLPLQPPGDDIDDYVRLLYVAITRAKKRATITSYRQDHAGRAVETSSIVQAALDVKTDQTKIDIIETLEKSISWPRLSTGDEKQMLKARLDTYQLSVTHLINFLDLENGGPKYFIERNLLRLPEPKQDHLAFGTAIHKTLEFAQINQSSDLSKIKTAFSDFLMAEQIANKSFAKQKQKGSHLLDKLFNDFKLSFPAGSLAEQDLKDVRLKDAIIRGKIDRIDFDKGKLIVVDYKTGSSLKNFESMDKTIQAKIWRHKLQLIFYALLIQNSPRFFKYKNRQVQGQMTYLEADNISKLNLTYTPTDEEINQLAKLVNAVYQKIINLDFPDVSKYKQNISGINQFEQDLINK